MSLYPSEFLQVANHLQSHASPQQGCLRSAVSRGYYAVFLTVKDEVTSRSYEFPTEASHGAVLYALKETRDRHALNLKDKIGRIREKREQADYNLDSGDFDTTEVEDILERCRSVCSELRNSVPDRLFERIGEELERRA